MVLGVRLVKKDEKEPVPIPSDVLVVRAIVGLVLVDQTTPLAVMDAPPSDVIFPPEVDVLVVKAEADAVVSVGIEKVTELVSLMHLIENPEVLKEIFV